MPDVLDRRALNRALLTRQLLVAPQRRPVVEVVEHLLGLQAQSPTAPYVGLWSRIEGFQPDELVELITSRDLVRILLMRGTLHLVSAADGLALRPAVQVVLDRGLASTYGTRLGGADLDDLAGDARTLVEERPRTPNEIGTILRERWPEADLHGLGVAARTQVPMVQVPPRGLWGQSGPAAHTTVETWLGKSCGPPMPLETLVLRYLRAFGPASVMDVQKWCGLTKLGAVVKRMGDQLQRFESTDGRPLFDLPHAPRPGGDLPVPPRFVADFDNLLMSHADRTRVLADVHKDHVFPVNAVIPGTVLVDGFVAATWKVTQEKSTAVLTVRPFERLPRAEVDGVLAEGERLLAWLVDDADVRDVRIAP